MNTVIDIFKATDLFNTLALQNKQIEQTSKKFQYAVDGEPYDFVHDRISSWFNPENVKHLGFSRIYPHKCPEQYRKEYVLSVHQSNYLSLLLITLLYADRKDIGIEDIGSGAGIFFIYLKSLGFFNFHGIDNFSQLSEKVFRTYMSDFNIQFKLNDSNFSAVVSNNVGCPIFPFRGENIPTLELICCYTNRSLEKNLFEFSKEGSYKFLCRDPDDICVAFCKADKHDDFLKKIDPYLIK